MSKPVILVVEDNDIQRKVIKLLSTEYGFDAVLCANGIDAVAMFKDRINDIDLVLMDLRLPDISGQECSALIRRLESEANAGQSIPIVAMTGYVTVDDKGNCIKQGFDDCLIKPFSSLEFRSIVVKWTAGDSKVVPIRRLESGENRSF